MELNRFTKDDQRRIEGVKVPFGADAWLRIAYWMNPRHLQALQRLTKGRNADIEHGLIEPGENLRLGCEAMAEAILLDWGGKMEENGTPIAYSRESAERVLFERTGFRDYVIDVAREKERFRAAEEAEAGKD